MKRRALPVVLVVATVWMIVPSIAPARSCEETPVYTYCGDHVPASKLPLVFSYSAAGAPRIACDPGATCSVKGVVNDAMTQWNAAFPGSHDCTPLCLKNSGTNTIGWAALADDVIGLTTISYSSAHRISAVAIQLNSARKWRFAGGPSGLATGTVTMATAGQPSFGDWLDVETVILHELGHALGLEHAGSEPSDPHARPWPNDLRDSAAYQQVMYGWTFEGVVKRTLREGDIAGIQRAAADSYFGGNDPSGYGDPVGDTTHID